MQSIIIRQYRFLARYLEPEFVKDPALRNANARPREKLQRLSHIQFSELLTDVADELQRRINNDPKVRFLPPVDSYHPKRNHARQKLSSLAPTRLRDLCMDVFFEVQSRYSGALKEVSSNTPPNMTRAASQPPPQVQRLPTSAPKHDLYSSANASSASLHPTEQRTTSSPTIPSYANRTHTDSPTSLSHRLPNVPDTNALNTVQANNSSTSSLSQGAQTGIDSSSNYLSRIEMLESSLAKSNSLLDSSKSEMEALKAKSISDATKHKNEIFQLEEKLHEASHEAEISIKKLNDAENRIKELENNPTLSFNPELEKNLKLMQELIVAESSKTQHIVELESCIDSLKAETERWKKVAINAKSAKIDEDIRLFTMTTVPMKSIRELISPNGFLDEQLYIRYFVEMNVFVASLRRDSPSQWMSTAKDIALTLEAIVSSLREKSLLEELPDLGKKVDDLCSFTNSLMEQVRLAVINGALLPIYHVDASACSISISLMDIAKTYGLTNTGKSSLSVGRNSLHPVDDLKALSVAKTLLSEKSKQFSETNQKLLDAISSDSSSSTIQQRVHEDINVIRDTLFDVSSPLELMRDRAAYAVIHNALQEMRRYCMQLIEQEGHGENFGFTDNNSVPPLTDLAFSAAKCFKDILRAIEDAEFSVQRTQFSTR
ncbi:GTPase activating protein [Schizosaccharomyces pombe]